MEPGAVRAGRSIFALSIDMGGTQVAATARLAMATEPHVWGTLAVFKSLQDARRTATELIAQPVAAWNLRVLSGVADLLLVNWTTDRLYNRELLLLWQMLASSPAVSSPSPSPSPLPPTAAKKPGPTATPKDPPKISKSRVEFRPQDSWVGEFGFDWMRIGGPAEKAGEDVYKNVVIKGTGGLSAAAAYTAMKSEYDSIPIEIASPPEGLMEYFVPYLNLFPKGTAGSPTPPFEAQLRILVQVEENAPDKLDLEYDTTLLAVDKRQLKDKAVGAKRVATDGTMKITCNAALASDQLIKVWATFQGERKLVGQLKLLKNGDSARKHIKFLLVKVKTNINGTLRTGSISEAEKVALRNVLFQALITCDMEEAASDFDMTTDDAMRIKTVGTAKAYGKFIYQKTKVDPTKTEGLFEDYIAPGAAKADAFFSYVHDSFMKATGNQKYAKHFTIFAFDEVPYDVTTYGQVQDIGVHNAALFAPAGGRKVTTMAHEILHGLNLKHTHDSPGPQNKYIFKSSTTDNIMSYSAARYSTWRRQWEVMQGGL
ncbi:MAG TPA: hypothetical protein VGV09_03840 [Steroidobacteraceae bacterium]|nr:hypothetical protein [Steroidobacteraceae bacterium]